MIILIFYGGIKNTKETDSWKNNKILAINAKIKDAWK